MGLSPPPSHLRGKKNMADTPYDTQIGAEGELARNDSVAVGVGNTIISKARNQGQPRKVILCRNISPNATDIITISFGNTATANTGIVLRQYESFTETTDAGYTAFQGQINAICATATGLLAVFER